MAGVDVEPCTLSRLLDREDLALRLVASPGSLPPGSLERAVQWSHISDLPDPRPFLSPGIVLLTTGAALDDDPAGVQDYVRRLHDGDVVGVAFGSGVIHPDVPAALRDACASAGLPLLEVPYSTPFIAVTRAVADMVAADLFARRTWELDAHRALAAAGLRPDPLGAVLAELADQLGVRVGLCDAGGRPTRWYPDRLRAGRAAELQEQVGAVLRRGRRAAVAVTVRGRQHTVWTFGRAPRSRGALVVETTDLDAESRGLVRTVIGMLGIAGEREETATRAHRRLRRAVLAALLAGETTLARQLAGTAWGGLPAAPVRVAVTGRGPHLGALRTFLELHGDPARTFAGDTDTGMVLITGDTAEIHELAARCGGRFGVSRPVRYDQLGDAVAQARLALDRGRGAVTAVEDVAPGGVLQAMGPDAVALGRAVLDPVLVHDAAHGTELVRTLRAWLAHGTEHEAAARALGVHRHTVRARVALIGRTLGRDVSAFPVQAELWAALAALEQG